MLFRLLKNVKKWVYKFVFENNLADVEVRMYFKEDKNDSNKG
jgi:hypothetical protein